MRTLRISACLLALSALAGCKTIEPYDYTNYRAHPPRSILVLPPLNETAVVEGTYGYLSTVTFPLAELGYYVFPIAVVDQMMKENGLPTAGEMHQAPLNKIAEITGADAVMYVTLQQYGSKYQLINTKTVVQVRARLVDTHTETVLWEGAALAQQNSSGSGNLLANVIAAAIIQAMNSSTDSAHGVSRLANAGLFLTKDTGLLHGPHHPEYEQAP